MSFYSEGLKTCRSWQALNGTGVGHVWWGRMFGTENHMAGESLEMRMAKSNQNSGYPFIHVRSGWILNIYTKQLFLPLSQVYTYVSSRHLVL